MTRLIVLGTIVLGLLLAVMVDNLHSEFSNSPNVDSPLVDVRGFCHSITADGMMPPVVWRIDRKGRYVCKWYLRLPSAPPASGIDVMGFCQWLTPEGMMPPVIAKIDRKGRYVCKWYLRLPESHHDS